MAHRLSCTLCIFPMLLSGSLLHRLMQYLWTNLTCVTKSKFNLDCFIATSLGVTTF